MHSKSLHARILDSVLSSGSSLGLWENVQSYGKTASSLCEHLLTMLKARSHIFAALKEGLNVGQLEIEDRHGTHFFGKPTDGRPSVQMKVRNDNVWVRVALSMDLGCKQSRSTIEMRED